MPFQQAGPIRFFTFPALSAFPELFHAVLTRRGGSSPVPWASLNLGGTVGDNPEFVLRNKHNALQAMPSGGLLEIKTATSQKVGREGVMVSVRDNGMGIKPEDQTRIFEPFFTTKADRGGTGLGLSVTYGIVSDHGGEIELVSQPGQGAMFTVWLPKV